VPFTRSTRASEPGRTSVLIPTCWSYWRNAHSFEAIVGDASDHEHRAPDRRARQRQGSNARARELGGSRVGFS
jgi:hypothetical protein